MVRLRVRFGLPECGGIELTIQSPGQAYRNNFDFIFDSLSELVTALAVLVDADGRRRATCHVGPSEFDLDFERTGSTVRLRILEHPSGSRTIRDAESVFELSGTYGEICRPFWRALRDLQGRCSADEFQRNFRGPFPADALERLTRRIREAT